MSFCLYDFKTLLFFSNLSLTSTFFFLNLPKPLSQSVLRQKLVFNFIFQNPFKKFMIPKFNCILQFLLQSYTKFVLQCTQSLVKSFKLDWQARWFSISWFFYFARKINTVLNFILDWVFLFDLVDVMIFVYWC